MSKQEHQVLFQALCGNSTGKILFLTLISNLTFRTTKLKAKNIVILPVLLSESIQILNFFCSPLTQWQFSAVPLKQQVEQSTM